jgi:hypothetical protein
MEFRIKMQRGGSRGKEKVAWVVTDYCYPDEGGARFLRNVGSYKSHTA